MIVLIVEDEPIIAVSLALDLEACGHTVVGPAATTREAIELAERDRPTLALVDITLGGRRDGLELARELQQLGIPSVFLTAQQAEAHANADAALGFISKPYTTASVCQGLEVIAAILEGRDPPTHTGTLEVFTRVNAHSPAARSLP